MDNGAANRRASGNGATSEAQRSRGSRHSSYQTFDPSETRLLISSSPVGRNGLLSLLSNALKADLTISGGLHSTSEQLRYGQLLLTPVRYSASFSEFAVHTDFASYRAKLSQAREEFLKIYHTVKDRVDSSLKCVVICLFGLGQFD